MVVAPLPLMTSTSYLFAWYSARIFCARRSELAAEKFKLDKRILFFKSRFHRPNDLIDDQRRVEHQLAFFFRAFDKNFLALGRS